MGSDFSKGKRHRDAERYGQIFLQTDKATYYGGETVTGRIYLNLFMPYPGKQLFLKLKGKESVHFVIQRQEQVQNHNQNNHHHHHHHNHNNNNNNTIGHNNTNNNNNHPHNQTTTRIVEDLFQERNNLIKLTVPIYSWGALMPGQFVIPFAFMLPSHLPSSFHQEGHRYLANISYRLEAILEPMIKHEPKLKFKQNFVVRTPVKNAAHSQASEIRTQLTTCCCCSQGSNVLKAHFEKNFYAPGEIAQVIMQLDNSQSKIDNTRLRFALKQRLALTAAGRAFTREFTKVERDLQGIRAGGASDSSLIAMNLPAFQGGDYHKVKSYNMTQYLISLRDDNSILNSATRSKFITSEYYLQASCPMDGCCANTPSISIPIEIYYPEFQLQQVPTPANWQPQVIESVTVSFAPPMGIPQPQVQVTVANQGPNMGYNDMNQMNQGQNYVGMNLGFGNMGQVQGQVQVQVQGQNYGDMNQGQNYGEMNQGQNYGGMNPGQPMVYGGNQQMPGQENPGQYDNNNYYKPYN